MADLQMIKDIAVIASPLTKSLVDLWIAPKIKSLGSKWLKNKKLQDHFFNNKFESYLNEKYKNYSIINILAFRNQQRLLKELYTPLTLQLNKNKKIEGKGIIIDGYKDDLLPKFKKVLVTDTAGMGKSTLSKKLFLSVIEENKGIPVFIELRRLNKDRKIIDEIFDELKLLNEDVDKKFILDLIVRGDFIFFLDGYDEIASINKKTVTEDLQKFINNANKNYFLLTSRPDESLASFGDFQEFHIKPLVRKEAFQLLKKYDENGELSSSLITKLEDKIYLNIREFLSNPLLVSLLFTAYEYKQTIPLKKHLFYRQVYDAIFEAHDLTKGDYFIREKYSQLGIDDFHTIMRSIGFICLKKDRIEFSKDEILDIISEANKYCEVIEFEESMLLRDLITTVPLFVKEGLYYKWTHKSLYEYFVAQFIYLDSKEQQSSILRSLITKDHNLKYFNIFDIYSNIDYRSFRNEVAFEVIESYLKYCQSSYLKFDFDIEIIRRRQELTYGRDLIIIQIEDNPQKENDRDSDTNKCFKIIENDKSLKDKNYGIKIIDADDANLNRLYVCDNVLYNKVHGNIPYILSQKEENVVKSNSSPEKSNFSKFSIPKNKVHFVNDEKENPLNSEENFQATNEIISLYGQHIVLLKYNECLDFIERIKKIKAEGKKSNFFEI